MWSNSKFPSIKIRAGVYPEESNLNHDQTYTLLYDKEMFSKKGFSSFLSSGQWQSLLHIIG